MLMGINNNRSIAWISEVRPEGFQGSVANFVEGAKTGLFFDGKKLFKSLECCILDLKLKRDLEARSGVVINGVEMQTDKESIAAMDQYATESMMNGLTVVHWEKADGTFHDWPIADFKKVFSEITKYVNNCFGRQSQLLDEINAAADPTAVDISQGWPSKTITFV